MLCVAMMNILLLLELQYVIHFSCVDDIMFSNNGPYGSVMLLQQPRCSFVNGLTPLLHDIGCILS